MQKTCKLFNVATHNAALGKYTEYCIVSSGVRFTGSYSDPSLSIAWASTCTSDLEAPNGTGRHGMILWLQKRAVCLAWDSLVCVWLASYPDLGFPGLEMRPCG